MHRSQTVARVVAAAGAVALVGVSAPAHAATEYDGSATALEVHGLRLELFPKLPEGIDLPPALANAPRTLVVPDRRVGHTGFDGSDTVVDLPDNPLLSVRGVEASSRRVGGKVVSEASVTGLDLAAGAVHVDLVKASCVGDGRRIKLSAPQAELRTTPPIAGPVQLEPGRGNVLPGLGRISYNVRDAGADSGSVANLVIELDSDLSLTALRQIPEAAWQLEGTLQAVLSDLRESYPQLQQLPDPQTLAGAQLYTALEDVVRVLPADRLPDQLDLNNVAHLSGRITVAAVQCSQLVTADPAAAAPEPSRPDQPAQPVGRAESPTARLADTGAPTGMLVVGLVGLAALAAGGWGVLRARRR